MSEQERKGLAQFLGSLSDADWWAICEAAAVRLKMRDPTFNPASEWDRLRFDYYGCIVLEATYRAELLGKAEAEAA